MLNSELIWVDQSLTLWMPVQVAVEAAGTGGPAASLYFPGFFRKQVSGRLLWCFRLAWFMPYFSASLIKVCNIRFFPMTDVPLSRQVVVCNPMRFYPLFLYYSKSGDYAP